MEALVDKIYKCINELDDIADDLEFTYGVDSTGLNKIADLLTDFGKKLNRELE